MPDSVHERGSERHTVDISQMTHSGSRPNNCVSSLLVCPVVIAIDEDLRESARVYVLVHACTNCKYITVNVLPRNGCVSVLLDILRHLHEIYIIINKYELWPG